MDLTIPILYLLFASSIHNTFVRIIVCNVDEANIVNATCYEMRFSIVVNLKTLLAVFRFAI